MEKNKKSSTPLVAVLQIVLPVVGTIAVAYFGYLAIVKQEELKIQAAQTAEAEAELTASAPSAAPSPAPIAALPKIYNFKTCTSQCNGTNVSKSFQEKVEKIYARFDYDNFQPGARYVRTWSLDGREWIRYSCDWVGPLSGTQTFTFKEAQGLHSGTWEITVLVDDMVVLKDQITINGNWDYWDPAGTIYSCYGTSE